MDALIAEIRLRAEAALYRRLDAGSGFADPRVPAQIYLRDPGARERLGAGTLRPRGTHKKALEAATAAIAEARAAGRVERVDLLGRRLGLDGVSLALAVAAAAYAIDLDVRELCHALSPRRAKPGLYAETCVEVLELPAAAVVAALAPGAALRRTRAITVDGEGLAAAIELTGATLAWLCGDDALPAPLAQLVSTLGIADDLGVTLPALSCAALDGIAARLRELAADASHRIAFRADDAAASGVSPSNRIPDAAVEDAAVTVILRGVRGSGRRAAAQRIARVLGRPLDVIPVPQVLAVETRAKAALLWQALASARLRDALPYLADADALYDERGELAAEHAAAIAIIPGPIVVGTAGRSHLSLGRATLIHALPRAELGERERAWAAALGNGASSSEAAELAARYVIGPGAIAEVAAESARQARASGATPDMATLEAAIGRRLALRVGSFGTVVPRKARFAELILPDDVIEPLRDLVAMVRERAQILERWGYQRHLGISRGVSALFSGEPGTGKTMAASVAASELGLELVRIDLSAVVSKYVGETEKNLARIFDEAQDAHAMLLFDEADSLFGKRTELRSAQDRFANLEVNYILQRMETFDGLSVLTTNAEAAIDQALQRRLNFRIRFPEPEPAERARLWQQLLPPSTGLHDRVDFAALAERFDMTGGYIKNAVVRAAVIAARANRAMVAEDLWLGAHNEYIEMGKVMPQPGGTL
jgi:hypothetical protein